MTQIGARSSAVFEPVDVITPPWTLDRKQQSLKLSRRVPSTGRKLLADWVPDVSVVQIDGVSAGDDLAILRAAYLEAHAFLGPNLKPRQKAEIVLSILAHARRGVRDPHRLAVKAIVSA